VAGADGEQNLPVDAVSWQEAVDFCNKLNAKKLLSLGWKFALPSEAQWEYACRAGTKGDNPGNPNAMAWHSGNSGDTTHPVGTKQPNAWGLYDMLGNVNEWCADWYGDYPKGAAKDWTGPKSGASRVNRGGDYYNASTFCNSTFRGQEPPSSHFCNAGFRVAVVPVH
jgi:formylglycine-generating enzyme required for sulfatase activity